LLCKYVLALSRDESANELLAVERRMSAISQRIQQLRAQPITQIDMGPTYAALFAVGRFWEQAIKEQFLDAFAPWGLGEHQMRPFIGQVPGMAAAFNLRQWLGTGPGPTPANITRAVKVYARALEGKIDLSADSQI
jgi:hypothetical protein